MHIQNTWRSTALNLLPRIRDGNKSSNAVSLLWLCRVPAVMHMGHCGGQQVTASSVSISFLGFSNWFGCSQWHLVYFIVQQCFWLSASKLIFNYGSVKDTLVQVCVLQRLSFSYQTHLNSLLWKDCSEFTFLRTQVHRQTHPYTCKHTLNIWLKNEGWVVFTLRQVQPVYFLMSFLNCLLVVFWQYCVFTSIY